MFYVLEYKYAGVRDGVDCYCANSYSRYGILPDMECNITCPGNLNENCGGNMKLSVYTTGYTGMNFRSLNSLTCRKQLSHLRISLGNVGM